MRSFTPLRPRSSEKTRVSRGGREGTVPLPAPGGCHTRRGSSPAPDLSGPRSSSSVPHRTLTSGRLTSHAPSGLSPSILTVFSRSQFFLLGVSPAPSPAPAYPGLWRSPCRGGRSSPRRTAGKLVAAGGRRSAGRCRVPRVTAGTGVPAAPFTPVRLGSTFLLLSIPGPWLSRAHQGDPGRPVPLRTRNTSLHIPARRPGRYPHLPSGCGRCWGPRAGRNQRQLASPAAGPGSRGAPVPRGARGRRAMGRVGTGTLPARRGFGRRFSRRVPAAELAAGQKAQHTPFSHRSPFLAPAPPSRPRPRGSARPPPEPAPLRGRGMEARPPRRRR